MPMIPDDVHIVTDLEALKVYFDPLRKRIVQQMVTQARSIHQVAEILGVPFTRLYYHFNLLEKYNFIRVVDIQQMNGAVEEKFFQVTAYQFAIDRSLLQTGTPEGEQGLALILDTVLEQARNNIVRGVRDGVIDLAQFPQHPDALILRRGNYSLTPNQARLFHDQLSELFKRIQTLPPDESETAQQYELLIGFYRVSDPPLDE